MKSLVATLDAPWLFRFDEQELNLSALGSTQIAVRTVFSAISPGTEIAAYSGAPPLRPGCPYPRTLGYLNLGCVLAGGSRVRTVGIGDHIVTTQPHRSAFICDEADVLLKVPEGADLRAAPLTYLFHLPYSALWRARHAAGQRIAVIGLGPIGLAAVALVRVSGSSVTAFTGHENSAALAREFGATEVRQKEVTGESGEFDIVIITSNSWADWRLALSLPRPEGCICVLGFPGRGQSAPDFNPLDPAHTYVKQVALLWCGNPVTAANMPDSFSLKRNMTTLYGLIRSAQLPAKELIGGESPWYEMEDVYRALLTQRQGRLSYLMNWGGATL